MNCPQKIADDLASMSVHLGKLRGSVNNDRGNDRGGGGRRHSGHRGSLGVSGASGIGEDLFSYLNSADEPKAKIAHCKRLSARWS